MLAITEAVAKFCHYLFEHYFIIRTDQKSLHHLTDQTIQTPEQEEWLLKLLGFRVSIEYKPGRTNVIVDALSRSFYMAISAPVCQLTAKIKDAVGKDTELVGICRRCTESPMEVANYSIRDGLLQWKGKVVIPKTGVDIQRQLLLEYHSSAIGGHVGVNRTFRRIATGFYWPSMKKDVQHFVQNNTVCQ